MLRALPLRFRAFDLLQLQLIAALRATGVDFVQDAGGFVQVAQDSSADLSAARGTALPPGLCEMPIVEEVARQMHEKEALAALPAGAVLGKLGG